MPPIIEIGANLNPHSTRCQPMPNFPRLRALALFGRRPPQRVDSLVMPASENQHLSRHQPEWGILICRITPS
jgi:hypothetical protein